MFVLYFYDFCAERKEHKEVKDCAVICMMISINMMISIIYIYIELCL